MKIEETIYPTLPPRVTEKVLQLNFTPTAADRAFVSQNTRNATNRSILLVLLKVTQYLGYVPLPKDIPRGIIKYVSASADSHVVLKKRQLSEYQHSGTYRRQAKRIREYLRFESDPGRTQAFCETVGVEVAQTKEELVDIFNALIEAMIRDAYELPAFSTVEKLARQCRVQANDHRCQQICQHLSLADRANLQALFDKSEGDTVSPWQQLKQNSDKPTPQRIQAFLDHLVWLKGLARPLPALQDLPVAKRQQFRDEAMAMHSSDMRALKQAKRYALAVTLIQTQLTQALDDLGEMFIKTVQDVENQGKLAYQRYFFENRERADQLIKQFQTVLKTYRQRPDEEGDIAAVEALLSDHVDEWQQACDQHLVHSEGKVRPFIVSAFKGRRALLFKILAELPLESDAHHQSVMDIGTFLMDAYEPSASDFMTLDADRPDLSEIPSPWLNLMIVAQDGPRWEINRFCLEIAWLITVKEQLKAFHCFVVGGEKYGNPSALLIDLEEYPALANEYHQLTGIPIEGQALVQHLKDELKTVVHRIDTKFPEVEGARVKGGKLILKPAYVNYSSSTLDGLRAALAQKMPRVSIVDAISDTVRWLGLEQYFRPHSGHAGKISDVLYRLVVTLFCFGCNVGPQQTTESIKGLSRKQVAWLNARYTNVKKLEKAIKKVVDTYARMELPKQWGDGTHASADGTHKATYSANLLSEFHFRYRKKGAVGCYLISDQYIALFSHFIACGVHESWYILDGVANNDMDIQPHILHGDTHSQNYVVFALAYLLGIQLMPRIRGIKHLRFFKPVASVRHQNIESLFDGAIQWHCIDSHLPEMLRIVLSIKKGIITPSAILRRLNSYNSKNSLYQAFQELGKAVRTLFLLRITDDMELRKIIHRETNKTEQHHAFAGWLFFGNAGVIRHNDRFEQEKIIKYHHLVTTLVVLFNAHHMTKALEALKREGYPIVLEDLAHLSPFHNFGLNLLGDYHPDLNRELEPIAFKFALQD